jgi:hypothetical protein
MSGKSRHHLGSPGLKSVGSCSQCSTGDDSGTKDTQEAVQSGSSRLFINLLARYAIDAPEKSDIENKLEAAMGDDASRRAVAQRLVSNFRKIPLAARANIFGALAEPKTETIPQQRLETAFRALQKNLVPTVIFDDVQHLTCRHWCSKTSSR